VERNLTVQAVKLPIAHPNLHHTNVDAGSHWAELMRNSLLAKMFSSSCSAGGLKVPDCPGPLFHYMSLNYLGTMST
jgi:hypothetical protein